MSPAATTESAVLGVRSASRRRSAPAVDRPGRHDERDTARDERRRDRRYDEARRGDPGPSPRAGHRISSDRPWLSRCSGASAAVSRPLTLGTVLGRERARHQSDTRRSVKRSRRFIALVTAVALWPLAATQPALARAPVIVAAGDIACGGDPCTPERRTARLIRSIGPRAVLALGDLQYPDGSLEDFRSSYDRTWGRFKDGRIRRRGTTSTGPTGTSRTSVPGRTDRRTTAPTRSTSVVGTFCRSTRAMGGPTMRSSGGFAGTCAATALGANWPTGTTRSTRPVTSTAATNARELWGVLFRAGVDVVLNSHEHNYERFALLGPTGAPRRGRDRAVRRRHRRRPLYGLSSDGDRGSQRRIDHRHGVLGWTCRTGYGGGSSPSD